MIQTEELDQAPATSSELPPPSEPARVADAIIEACGWMGEADGQPVPLLRVHNQAFYVWKVGAWRPVTEHEMRVAVQYTTRSAFYDAGPKGPRPWNPTTHSVSEVVRALREHPTLQVPSDLRAPAWLSDGGSVFGVRPDGLVAVRNGLVDVGRRHGGDFVVYEHTPTFWSHAVLPVQFSGSAPEPARWMQFLDEVFPNDPASAAHLQEMFGYIVSGRTDLQKAFAIIGPKRSGKGTIARVLRALVGHDAYVGTSLSSLARNFGLQALIGKSLAVVSDARVDSRASMSDAVERLLSITGEDYVPVDIKFQSPITVQLQTRFLLLTNETPKLPDASGALASRFILIPMTRSFFGKEDPNLTYTLETEAPGILQWALEGLERLELRGHLVQTAAGQVLIDEMEVLGSPVKAFVRDECVVGPNESVETMTLYRKWDAWAIRNGHVTGSVEVFGRNLAAAVGVTKKRVRSAPTGNTARNTARNTANTTGARPLHYRYFGIGLRP